jgi:hypothetical protein
MGNISLCQTHKSYPVLHIRVPLGIFWFCVNPSCFTLVLILCGMLGLSAFMFLCGFWGKWLCWRVSFNQSHWKQPGTANDVHESEIKFDPKRLVEFLLDYLVVDDIGCQNFFQLPYLHNKGECCWLYVNLLDVDLTFRASMYVPQFFVTLYLEQTFASSFCMAISKSSCRHNQREPSKNEKDN